MRKIIFTIAILLCSFTFAGAQQRQQVTNGDFEQWTFDGENLPNYFNSYQTSDGSLASTGYNSSNRQVKRSTDTRPGSTGKYSCAIWAREIKVVFVSVIAQGSITTGRVHAASASATGADNYIYSDRDGSNTNNGVTNPCAMPFTDTPDSIVVWVKFAPAGNDTKHPNASIHAYIHDNVDFKDGYAIADDTDNLVASASLDFPNTNGWKRLSLPFVYTGHSEPHYLLLNFATNAYPGGGSKNDYLYIDDIEMIYNPAPVQKSHTLNFNESNGWASMYVDFKTKVPADAEVYYVNSLVTGYAKLKQIPAGTVIPANTGVIVRSSKQSVTFESCNDEAQAITGNLLTGVLEQTGRDSQKTYYVLSPDTTTPQRAAFGVYTGSSLGANKAFIVQ